MEPINYMLDVKNPIEEAMRGYAIGRADIEQRQIMQEREQIMGMRDTAEARAASEFEMRRAEAERLRADAEAKQARFVEMRDKLASGEMTTSDFSQWKVENAQTVEEMTNAVSAIEKPKLEAMARSGLAMSTALLKGNIDAAFPLIDEYITAAENTGTPEAMQEAKALEAIRRSAEIDPESAGLGLMLDLYARGLIDEKVLDATLKAAGQGDEATESFRTADQKLRASKIFPREEGGDGSYEQIMQQSLAGGGRDFSLTVDPTTGAVSFSEGSGSGAGSAKPTPGYVTVPTEGGVEQRVITGSPAAQEVTKTAAQLDANLEQANRLVSLVQEVRDNPELDAVTGFAEGRMPTGRPSIIPEKIQARQDLIVKIDQLKGNVFLQAYESLKGSGQITEIEGIKAEAAIARMNRAQGGPAFRQALNDFLDVIETAQNRITSQKSGLPKETAPSNQGLSAEDLQYLGVE
jgi:hypothetical protein